MRRVETQFRKNAAWEARVRRSLWQSAPAMLRCAATAALIAVAVPALAQDGVHESVVGTAALPRDLSPWGMYINADPVVKAVLIGLAFASVVTWTVWLAKTIEIVLAKRRVGARSKSGITRES